MDVDDLSRFKKEIGDRFVQFRKAIGKTQVQLGEELNIHQSGITNIEKGKIFPRSKYLIHWFTKYRLNTKWLLGASSEMFLKKEKVPAYESYLGCHIHENEPGYEKYVELLDLMQIPLIETIILGRLAELKLLTREEIKMFKRKKKKGKKQF